MQPLIVHHPAYVAPLPAGHRFPMPKFGALFRLLVEQGLAPEPARHVPAAATAALLASAHAPAYVAAVLGRRLSAEAVRRLGLPLSAAVVTRASTAVAGTLLTARLALAHGLACNTAGGSHHAFAGFGAGFCVFNDVAVATAALLAEGRVARVLVVDLDVHQGDGTAAIFRDEPRVTTLSVHCRTNFPARKQQSTLDVALDPELGDRDYLAVVRPLVEKALDGNAPDLGQALVLEACRRRGLPLAVVVGGGYATDVEVVAARHALLHRVAADLAPW